MLTIKRIKNRGCMFSWDVFGDCLLNIYLIKGSERQYLIDSGLGSGSIESIKDYLDLNKPTVLINTHYHWDHVWGNGALKNITVISHELCRERMQKEWDKMLKNNDSFADGIIQMRLPDLVFNNTLCFPDDGLKLFYSPGHTQDSISIFDEAEGILICGDNVGDTTDDIIPSIYIEKSFYIESVKAYQRLDFDTVISGHNEVLSKNVFSRIMDQLKSKE